MTAISCGCEPLWPSGVDRSGCWWHSALDGRKGSGGTGSHSTAAKPHTTNGDADSGASSGDGLLRATDLPWNFVTDHLPDHMVPTTGLPARIEFRTEGVA